jgi:hypothetical protein
MLGQPYTPSAGFSYRAWLFAVSANYARLLSELRCCAIRTFPAVLRPNQLGES